MNYDPSFDTGTGAGDIPGGGFGGEKPSRSSRRLDMRRVLIFAAAAIVMGCFWHSLPMKPLRIFVVFLHEASHAIMTVATGGKVESMGVLFEEGGHVMSRGGSRFWTLTAGYLGSLAWGSLIMLISCRTKHSRPLAMAMGVGSGLITIFYMSNGAGLAIGLGAALFFILGSLFLIEGAVVWTMRIIGLASCLYATYDIASDVLFRPEARSDAHMLADEFGFPPFLPLTYQTLFWGVVWILISIAATALTVWVASAKAKEPAEEPEEPQDLYDVYGV